MIKEFTLERKGRLGEEEAGKKIKGGISEKICRILGAQAFVTQDDSEERRETFSPTAAETWDPGPSEILEGRWAQGLL